MTQRSSGFGSSLGRTRRGFGVPEGSSGVWQLAGTHLARITSITSLALNLDVHRLLSPRNHTLHVESFVGTHGGVVARGRPQTSHLYPASFPLLRKQRNGQEARKVTTIFQNDAKATKEPNDALIHVANRKEPWKPTVERSRAG